MSASREKKMRQNQERPAKQTAAPKKCKALKRVLSIVIAVVLVIAIVFLSVLSTSFFEKNIHVAEANGHKLTAAQVNFYYAQIYSQFGGMLDSESSASEQYINDDSSKTWHDYFIENALTSAANNYAVYDLAVSEGFTLSEEGQANVDAQIMSLDVYAASYGYPNADSFVAGQYGAGCDVEGLREFLTVSTLASEYRSKISEGFSYTQEDLDAEYAEDPTAYEGVAFRAFSVTPSLFSDEADEETAMTLCKNAAEDMAAVSQGNEQAFLDYALELTGTDVESYDPASSTLRKDTTKSSVSATYREWLCDEARQTGDAASFENGDNGYVVVYFLNNVDRTYKLPNVRHILVQVEDSTDAEAMAAAQEEAQKILDEYLAGEQTEDAFAALAANYSDDNADEGGLYENITKGTMVEPFENWCFEDHEVGDTGIVETTYGYHVMYFSGYGDTYLNYTLENALRSHDYSNWYADTTENATYTLNNAFKKLIVER